MKENQRKSPKIQQRFDNALQQCRHHIRQAVAEYQLNMARALESWRDSIEKTH